MIVTRVGRRVALRTCCATAACGKDGRVYNDGLAALAPISGTVVRTYALVRASSRVVLYRPRTRERHAIDIHGRILHTLRRVDAGGARIADRRPRNRRGP